MSFSDSPPRMLSVFGGTASALGISGGDRHSLEIWRNWHHSGRADVVACMSAFGAGVCQKFGYDLVIERFEDDSKEIGPWRLEYVGRFLRQVRLLARLGNAALGYSASAYYYDVVPLAVMQCLGRLKFSIVPVFHLVPAPKERGWSIQNIAAWLEQRVVLRLLRCMRAAIVIDNDVLATDLVKLGFERRNLVLSGMGVPQRTHESQSAQAETAAFASVYVGRLSVAKGVPLLIEAWSLVCKLIPGARLALVGSRDSSLDIDACLRRFDLSDEQASVYEGLSDAGVQSILRRSRCFVIASREEGYCLAVGEAMREGLPCVTFDLPAFRFAYPYGRVVVVRKSAKDFSHAICNLLTDHALYERLVGDISSECSFRPWPAVAQDLWEQVRVLAFGEAG